MPQPFVFVDVETSGISLRISRIIEIGMIRVEDGKIIDTFSSLINPSCYLSEEITALTGITPEMLSSAPSFRDVSERVVELLDGAILVAHNISFDYSYLKKELKLLGIPYRPSQLCTVKLSRALFPEELHHNLDAIISKYHFHIKNRHRALDDAQVLVQFIHVLKKQYGENRIDDMIKKVIKSHSIPPHLDATLFRSLPEAPGVYIFYGEAGCVLYVGKSINIKERVLSHFYDATTQSIEYHIAQQVTSIETQQTAGELGALLLESRLIKKLLPLYNRRLRRKNSCVIIFQTITDTGYLSIEKERMDILTSEHLSSVLGIFPSQKKANDYLFSVSKTYMLCEKLMGLSKTKGECFSYQMNLCHGACIQKEKIDVYNARFLLAFSQTKIKKWPFDGLFIIPEENEYEDKVFHVFDQWCYLGSYFTENDIKEIFRSHSYKFDFDIYKILRKVIVSQKEGFVVSSLENMT